MDICTKHSVEITKELFYRLISASEDDVFYIDSKAHHTDVFFRIDETIIFRRTQGSGTNYYVVDINS